jgi:hypothetical protein
MKFLLGTVVCVLSLVLTGGEAFSRGGHGGGGGHHSGGHHSGGHHAHSAHRSTSTRSARSNRSAKRRTTVRKKSTRHVRHHKHRRHHHRHRGGYGDADGDDGDSDDATADAARYGVLILDLSRGPAARAGLQVDDIILSFNGVDTPSYEALAGAVQQAGDQAEVVYIDGDTGEETSCTVYPAAGRIGVTGQGVRVD